MHEDKMQTKKCSKCKQIKPFSEYFKDNRRPIGIRCRCITCCQADTAAWREKNRSQYNNYAASWRAKNPEKQHANEIKRNYGLSKAQYEELLKSQKSKCKICGKKHDTSTSRGRLYVDHCHINGTVRGLLCGACNSGIGYLKHDTKIVAKALEYLRPVF